MVELAIATGIPATVWADEPAEAVATAVEILNEMNSKRKR